MTKHELPSSLEYHIVETTVEATPEKYATRIHNRLSIMKEYYTERFDQYLMARRLGINIVILSEIFKRPL